MYDKVIFYQNNRISYINYNELNFFNYIYKHKIHGKTKICKLLSKDKFYKYLKDYIQLFIDYSKYEMDYDYSVIKFIGKFEPIQTSDITYYNIYIDEELKTIKLEGNDFNYKVIFDNIKNSYNIWNGTIYNKDEYNKDEYNKVIDKEYIQIKLDDSIYKIKFIKYIIETLNSWINENNKIEKYIYYEKINHYKCILASLYCRQFYYINYKKIKYHIIVKYMEKIKQNNTFIIDFEILDKNIPIHKLNYSINTESNIESDSVILNNKLSDELISMNNIFNGFAQGIYNKLVYDKVI